MKKNKKESVLTADHPVDAWLLRSDALPGCWMLFDKPLPTCEGEWCLRQYQARCWVPRTFGIKIGRLVPIKVEKR